ncbi:MAG: ribosome silencing factor [Pseudomonadota bacterium]
MDIKTLQALVVDALEDVKAQEIRVYDTMHLTSMFDRIVIASGTSNRQTRALAMSVRDKVKSSGGEIINMEGENTGEWVLVDLGDIVVHIMQPAIRAYYRLEEIWGDKEVKLGAAKRAAGTARKASQKAASDGTQATAKTAAKKATAKKSATTKAPAKKAPARKTPAKKATVAVAAKTTSKTASKTASKAASKTAAKKPVARKMPVKKSAAKKSAAR